MRMMVVYNCRWCGNRFEWFVRVEKSDKRVACPKCKTLADFDIRLKYPEGCLMIQEEL